MSAPRYFLYPFGLDADDLAAIPDGTALDGSVSYQDGWTPSYELDLLTNPAALPIPRGQMNQLFLDITKNLQQYQQYGAPVWYSGVSYPIYSRVYYSSLVYESAVAANTATPGADSTWRVVSGNVGGLPIGALIDYAGFSAPTNFLLCDGSAVSRTTYAGLLAAISQTQNGTTTNTSTTITGLTDTSSMYIGMHLEGTGIPVGATVATIASGTSVTISAAATASATVSIKFYNWGNGDGSTTFNVPDFRRYTSMGSGGSGSATVGNVAGQSGGAEGVSLSAANNGPHTHTGTIVLGTDTITSPANNGLCQPNQGGHSNTNISFTTDSQGSGTAHNNVQPSVIVTKCIKYQ